jgi:hypothetical protein
MGIFNTKSFVLPVKQEFERFTDLDIIEKLLYICAVNSVFSTSVLLLIAS